MERVEFTAATVKNTKIIKQQETYYSDDPSELKNGKTVSPL